MAIGLSFGNLVKSGGFPLALDFGTKYGDTRDNPNVYDDAILRKVRSSVPKARYSTNRTPTSITRTPLTFGSNVLRDTLTASQSLSFPASVPKSNTNTPFFSTIGNFLSGATFGTNVNDTRSIPGVYDDAILRASRVTNGIPRVSPTITKSVDKYAFLKDATLGLLSAFGSNADDSNVTPVSYTTTTGGGEGFNPLWIAGAALAAGAAYFAFSK